MKTCIKCKVTKDDCLIVKGNICNACHYEYFKIWKEKNKEHRAQWSRQWRIKNRAHVVEKEKIRYASDPEHHRQRSAALRRADPSTARARVRAWQIKYPHKQNALNQARHAQKLKACPRWANKFFMEEAYHLAALRTQATGFSWNVDHIVPLRSKVVCGLHCEQNMQVIPKAENATKGNRYWPDMPEIKN